MKKNILVTGVAGMIGSHLAEELLSRGYNVIGIDDLTYGRLENIKDSLGHERFRFYKVSIMDFDTLKILSRDIDTIIHLAAVKKIAEKDISLPTLVVNTQGTVNIFEVAKMWGCKVVFASTSDVYGMSPDLPLNEEGDLLLGPSMIRRWSYAVSKLYGEQLAFGYYNDHKVPMVIIRYFGAFSPRSSFAWSGGHVPIFINAILNNEEVVIHGDGLQTRSMGFVSDLVHGTVLALESPAAIGEVINIGNDEELSVLETAKLIHKLSGSSHDLKLKFVPMSEVFGKYKDIQRRIPDLAKAKRILGYQPKVRLAEAIKLTLEEIKKAGNASQ
ncbi:MAG: GDP-mannose 4,6-dehydratase [Bacteroidota bacterium]